MVFITNFIQAFLILYSVALFSMKATISLEGFGI